VLVPAVLGVGALLFPAVADALSRETGPGEQPVHEVELTDDGQSADAGFAETAVVDDETHLVGVKWNGAAETEFTVEVQEDDGAWTRPYQVEGMDIGPDADTQEAQAVTERRGSDFITEPVSVDDPSKVRVRVPEGVATDVELVTVGGDAARPTDEPAPPPPSAPPETAPPETTIPLDANPPDGASPGGTPPSAPAGPPAPPPAPPSVQASALTWTGLALVGVSVAGWLVVARGQGRRLRRRGIFCALVVMGAVAATGCFGGGGRVTNQPPWPGIFPRTHWGGPDGPPCAGYTSSVRFGVVHHTGGGPADNSYGDPRPKIHGIYAYHLSAGYCDIAYNFLVDKYGGIWEGRAGGMDKPVWGAHTLNFNSESTGVALLGDHTSAPASGAAKDALVRLLAWKFSIPDNTVDPYSPVSKNGYWISPVSAHRELFQTGCPGNAFYPELAQWIRGAVAAQVFYGSPVGNFEYGAREGGFARVAGWALDPDTINSIGIHVYVGPNGYAPGVAGIVRQDIANLYPAWGGWHGFDFSVPISGGPTNACVYALNVSHGGPVELGCRTV
jgi:N-acetylmuramoyl-L-alanine amidase